MNCCDIFASLKTGLAGKPAESVENDPAAIGGIEMPRWSGALQE
jgi:hypothetical protein